MTREFYRPYRLGADSGESTPSTMKHLARPQARKPMTTLTEDQARGFMHKLLAAMSQQGGSDLFISADFPPSMKAHGVMTPLTSTKLTGEVTRMLAHAIMNEEQRAEFAKEMERNFAINVEGLSRFRVNVWACAPLIGPSSSSTTRA